jgi:hypothetical protein
MTSPPRRRSLAPGAPGTSEDRLVFGVASAAGGAHREAGRNNQDAAASFARGSVLCVCVSDGCSALPAAEVGAHLTARTAVRAAVEWAEANPMSLPSAAVDPVLDEVIAMLQRVASAVGGAEQSEVVISELLLATMLVALVTPRGAAVFGVGDGVVARDEDVRIELTTSGGPSYPAYRLGALGPNPSPKLFFVSGPDEWSTLTLATDGAEGLFAKGRSPARALPREAFARSAALRWQLETIVREAALKSADDVTIGMIARRREEIG